MYLRNRYLVTFCALALALLVAVPADAYPPGRRLTVALGVDLVAAKTGQTSLSVANARPGKISIQVGKFPKIFVSQAGFTTKVLKGYPSGIYDVKVISPAWRDEPDEIAVTKIYVPAITAPTKGVITGRTLITVNSVKSGTIVAVTPTSAGKKGRTVIVQVPKGKTKTTITLPARTFSKGTRNSYEVAVGPKIKVKYSFNGLETVRAPQRFNARTPATAGANKESFLSVDTYSSTSVSETLITNSRSIASNESLDSDLHQKSSSTEVLVPRVSK